MFIEIKKIVEFNLSLIKIKSSIISIPDKIYNSSVIMSSNYFSKICKEFYSIDGPVKIILNKEKIKFSIENEMIGGSFYKEAYNSDDPESFCKIETTENVSFPILCKFLKNFTKTGILGQNVYIYLSKNAPLLVKYNLDELGVVKFFSAELNPDIMEVE